uniref:Polycystin cation channel PKD1/PKD2 domain-containing protein n=2 Tax=Ciona intestinalis TaxID=7719 RepID=F6XD75_CIOIN
MTLVSHSIQEETLEKFQQNTYIFANFQTLATLNENLRYLAGFIIFLETMRVLEFFRHQKHMRKFSLLFLKSKKVLAEFFLHFLLSMAAYAGTALILFSQSSINFQTYAKTFQSLFGILLGDETYEEISMINRVMGKILFFVFSSHITFLLVNLFIGLIDILFHAIRDDPASVKSMKGEYFMVAIIQVVNFFRGMLNLDNILYNIEESDAEEDAEVLVVDKPDSAGVSQPLVRIRRKKKLRRKRRNRINPMKSGNLLRAEELSEAHLEALRKLRRLEKAVNDIDISSAQSRRQIAGLDLDAVADDVDFIYEGIRDELKYL